ncbi:MAG: hypothetical protein R6V58_00955 [Planctomycetota bacterium]
MTENWRAAVVVALALWGGGCLQLETQVELHEDGSATVTERVRFSKRLLDLASKEGGALQLAPLLEKKSAVDRAKLMGKGVRLRSHEVREVAGGDRECVTVYHVDDIGDLTYVSPFCGNAGYPHRVRFSIGPNLSSRWTGYRAGEMTVHLRPYKVPESRQEPARKKGEDTPKPPAPSRVQGYRELAPVFRDMLEGFQVRMTFQCYAPVRVREGLRGSRTWMDPRVAGIKTVTIVDFDDEARDKYGYPFVENEELMIDLLRWHLDSSTMKAHLEGWKDNRTLPVLRGRATIWFRPSRPLFEEHFKGKTLDYGKHGGKKKATFERIGHKDRE